MTDQMTGPAAQVWDAKTYAQNAGFVPVYGEDVLAWLAPQAGEQILDLGCGDGVLTARIAEAGAVVTGLEPSPSLAEAARSRGFPIIEQDAHAPFGAGCFDAVFSNAALHWMRTPETVLANAYHSLRPGGRFVAEQGGFGNVAAICIALSASLEAAGQDTPTLPWDFPTPAVQSKRLETAGFTVDQIALIPRPTPLPTGWAGWLATFAGDMLSHLAPEVQTAVVADTARRLAPLTDETGTAQADYVRLRFVAHKSS